VEPQKDDMRIGLPELAAQFRQPLGVNPFKCKHLRAAFAERRNFAADGGDSTQVNPPKNPQGIGDGKTVARHIK
jgi:hypothetical protein